MNCLHVYFLIGCLTFLKKLIFPQLKSLLILGNHQVGNDVVDVNNIWVVVICFFFNKLKYS